MRMPATVRRYIALTTKEVQQLRRNRVLLIQLLLPPTIVLVIFGFALNPRVRDLRLGVVDESYTAQSRNFIDSLSENVNFQVMQRYLSAKDAEEALKNLDLDLFIVIPVDFATCYGPGSDSQRAGRDRRGGRQYRANRPGISADDSGRVQRDGRRHFQP